MNKRDLPNLQRAISDHRRVVKDYKRSNEQCGLLLDRYDELEKVLLDDFFKVSTDKPVKKPVKKVVKPEKIEKSDASNKSDKSGGKLAGVDSSKIGLQKDNI